MLSPGTKSLPSGSGLKAAQAVSRWNELRHVYDATSRPPSRAPPKDKLEDFLHVLLEHKDSLLEIFTSWDADGTGAISVGELHQGSGVSQTQRGCQ
eukprot:858590-Prymnesium_polylepis.1